jgi:hypothetical protein
MDDGCVEGFKRYLLIPKYPSLPPSFFLQAAGDDLLGAASSRILIKSYIF